MTTVFDWFIFGSFALYLLLMLSIGFACSKRQENLGDYYLGGRKMNKWVVALSAQASDMSGWLLMGLPGAVYVAGISESWIGIGLGIGTYLNWKIIAGRLRRYSEICSDSITIPDFLANRLRDKTGMTRLVSALIILVFFTFYTASGFVSAAKLFSVLFPVSYTCALLFGVAVVVSYTLLGGYMAVCWTDLVQGLLMFFAIIIIPAIILTDAGGVTQSINQLNAVNPNLLDFFTNAQTGVSCSTVALISSMAWGLGYFGMPHILVRFMSISSPAEIKGSRRIAMIWVVISLISAITLGLVFHIFLARNNLTLEQTGGDPERCFMIMINRLFADGAIMRIFAGLMLSAIMAAIMSTADSQLLVSASSFANDIYKRFIRSNASNMELITVSRCTVAGVALIAAALALNTEGDFFKVVMKMVSFAWGGFGASFGPVMLLALYWRRLNLPGAVAGMITGTTTCFIWKFVVSPRFADTCEIFKLYELAPGFLFALIATFAVSLLTAKPSDETIAEFDSLNQKNQR